MSRSTEARIVRTVIVSRGETVEIQWFDVTTGQTLVERHSAPPQATWDARRDQDASTQETDHGDTD